MTVLLIGIYDIWTSEDTSMCKNQKPDGWFPMLMVYRPVPERIAS